MADAAGTATWTYDPDTGQPASAAGPFDNDTLAYTWDPAGRRLTTALDGTAVATYTYDTLGRLAGVSAPRPLPLDPPYVFTYSYLGASAQVTSLAMPGSITTTRTYDSLGRLVTVSSTNRSAAPGLVPCPPSAGPAQPAWTA